MKKILFLNAFIVLTAFTSYNKTMVTDYRDAYAGNYMCKRTYTNVNNAHTALVTQNGTRVISVTKSATDSMMEISTGDGTFMLKFRPPSLINTLSGSLTYGNFFASDSILLNFIPSKMAPVSYIYRGRKQ